MTQLPLLADVERTTPRPWKRTTGTSRQAIRVIEANGRASILRLQVLKAIRAIWNRTQQSPTADEISAYLHRRGVLPDAHPQHVKPRLCQLERGWKQKKKDAQGAAYTVVVGGGLIEKAGKRVSSYSGLEVHTWRAVEIGTEGSRSASGKGAA